MKQTVRLFVKPGTFFGQLQWSTHHWLILVGFFIASAVETQLGSAQSLYRWYASFLNIRFGMELGTALWVITFLRLSFLLVAAWLATQAIWIFGTLLGEHTSRRVLFRRMAVVFTILLSGYTAQHLSGQFEFAAVTAIILYVWGVSLGYFALSEQFRMGRLQTLATLLFAGLVISQGWRYSDVLLRAEAVKNHSELTERSSSQSTQDHR